jgi:DNA-binding response OmpR family regulator
VKLLIIDSNKDWVEMLTGWLKSLGFEVYRAYTGEKAKTQWMEHQPDLVILDASLPDFDALTMCQEMCSMHDALVLAVTEGKETQDEIRCLESGADDYLRKPFLPAQLLAHIHAISRRVRSTLEQKPSSILTIGPIHVDARHNEAMIHGKISRLTPNESKLLHLLAINANDVCTMEQIVTHVWGYDGEGEASLIKAYICHLRKKIEPNPAKPRYIITVPGVGYKLIRYTMNEQNIKEGSSPLRIVVSR